MTRSPTRHLLLALALVFAIGMSGIAVPSASAHPHARITLHVNWCPANTTDVFGKCHDNRVAGAVFYIAGAYKVTNWNGIATGAPSPGFHYVRVGASTASAFKGSYVYCKDQVTGKVLYDGPTTSRVGITTVGSNLTICDWYLLT
jgi:hypothetical protein